MSATTITAPAVPPITPGPRLSPQRRNMFLALGAVFVLSMVRILSNAENAEDLTSSGTIAATLRVAAPIMLAGMAALWAERAGVINIGIEGIMIVGTWLGGFGAWKWGSWAGIGLAMVGGAIVGLIHAVAVVRFNIDHSVSGIALLLLCGGTTEYLSIIAFKGQQGGGESQSPPGKGGYGEFDMPFLAGGNIGSWKSPDLLGAIERQEDLPLVSDLAAILRGLISDVDLPVVVALLLVAATAWVLWRTRFGLRVRSSGESPQAGESLGVPINRVRYQALAISGAFAGFGGAYLSCVVTNTYRQGQTGGQGFIGLATNIFGNYQPFGVFRGALLFAFPTALGYRDAVLPLFLFAAVMLALLAGWLLLRRRIVPAVVSLVVAAVSLIVFLAVDKIPQELTPATPYVVTLIVLALARQSLRPPAHAGLPYRPGENH
jgi:simple sugar transport system permease protein